MPFSFSGSRQEVNSTWYSEIEGPIKSREKHYSLVLYITNSNNCRTVVVFLANCNEYPPFHDKWNHRNEMATNWGEAGGWIGSFSRAVNELLGNYSCSILPARRERQEFFPERTFSSDLFRVQVHPGSCWTRLETQSSHRSSRHGRQYFIFDIYFIYFLCDMHFNNDPPSHLLPCSASAIECHYVMPDDSVSFYLYFLLSFPQFP